jgi:hypothetical protein
MTDLACDRCGRSLLVDEDVRYEVKIEVWAAYDPMEISREALEGRDLDEDIRRLVAACEDRSADELEAEVHKSFRFDLCLRCQREFVRDPLGNEIERPPAQDPPPGR